MLRAFDQPVGIMSGKTERYSADIDKETEVDHVIDELHNKIYNNTLIT